MWARPSTVQDMRIATASERLTLEEEFEMQRKWREDGDKLTFIVARAPPARRDPDGGDQSPTTSAASAVATNSRSRRIIATVDDARDRIIGDVNLFLADEDEDYNEEEDVLGGPRRIAGEVELMVADRLNQGRGYGRTALLMFLHYVVTHRQQVVAARRGTEEGDCELTSLRVKINKDNLKSLKLFEHTGFVKTSQKPNYFGEYELVLDDLDSVLTEIEEMAREYDIGGVAELEYTYVPGGKSPPVA